MTKVLSHRYAIAQISEKMNLPKAGVEKVIVALFSHTGMGANLKHPTVADLPYIGTLVPDMRVHRHLISRAKRTAGIKLNRHRKKKAVAARKRNS